MHGKRLSILTAFIIFALGVGLGAPSWSDVTGRPHDLSLDNPRGHCLNCHDLHQTGLGEGFAHNLKRANEIAVCYQCHAGVLNDYTAIDPSFNNKEELLSQYDILSEFSQPHIHFELYGMDGEHNKCSYCHNPHGVFDPTSTTRLPKLLSAGPDVVTDTDEYCFVCHNSDSSPPHLPFPNISVGDQFRFSRDTYSQMTHSTFYRATTVTEPVPDTANTYDDNPYGAGKDISCLTCHRPHGSANEHMLKSPDDETFCLSCHDGTKADDLSQFDVTGHGKAGADRICQDCHFPHGTGQENAIKTKITDPHTATETTADVSGQGMNEACFACHGAASASVYANSFPSNVSDWYGYGATTTWSGTVGHSAAGSLKQVTTYATDYYSYISSYKTVQPNTQYTMSGYLYLPQTLSGTGARLRVIEYDAANAVKADKSSASSTTTSGLWLFKSFSFTTGATTTKVILRLNLNSIGTAYWDDVALQSTPYIGGYFPGKTAYNASIHKTSANAHNPADTSGDLQPGECDNCHDPHGRGNPNMLVDAGQTLCYDCHNASTPNTVSGDDVQAAFQMASHHDLTKVACVNCHNVHKATQSNVKMDPYNPDGVETDTNTFCLRCHSGVMPSGVTGAPDLSGEWNGGGHDTTHTLTCSDCHEEHGSQNQNNINYRPVSYGGNTASFTTGMGFGSRSFCEACHNRTGAGYKGAKVIPTGAGFVSQHGSGDSTACSTCHAMKHDPRLSNYTGSSSFYTVACLECHKQGVGNPYPQADTEFNTPSNPSDANSERSIHNVTYKPYTTTAAVDCTVCHGDDHEADHSDASRVVDPDPANPAAGSLDVNTSNNFCLQCHDSTPVSIGGMTPLNIMDIYTSAGHGTPSAGLLCTSCHVHHGSDNEKLIRSTINGNTVLSTYSGNNSSVCVACHRGTDPDLPAWPGFSVYSASIHAFGNTTTGNFVTDGRHGAGACVNCHNPHGSRVDGETTASMARKDHEDLCYSCHASGFDNFSTSGDYNDKWTRFGSVLTIAKENGALHVGRNVISAGTSVSDGLESTASFPDSDAVITVRMKLPEFTRTDGTAVQFGIWVYDPWNSANYVRLFYRGHSNPNNWIVRFTNDGGVLGSLPLFGDEATNYHTLKLVRNKSTNQLAAYIDDTLVYTCPFSTAGYFKVKLFHVISGTADATPETLDIRYDEFRVDYTYDGTAHNTASRDDVQARFYMKSHHKISDVDQLGTDGLPGTSDDAKVECSDCHDPHTITEKLMAFKNVSGCIVPIEADQEFCLKCHDGEPPAGIQFPSSGVWDKSDYDLSAHGNPLMRDRTFGNYSNGVVYPCKVCHNPHGSEQAALQRESWDIDRDGIPDDIDGDGLLDSSTMVGFIGYSSGSRKVILVDSPRPGFQRISSTIPYQGNGSIDVELCLNCHDGTPAPDVETDFKKLSHHPVEYSQQIEMGGAKIECYHCHDQHRAQARDDQAGRYATTNPDPPREPMLGDAKFCLRCHDNTLPSGVSFGTLQLKNVKLSYNPYDLRDANGYDLVTSFKGHYVQSTGKALMCRECHNQHGSDYSKMIRDNTEQARPNHDPSQSVQEIIPIALRPTDTFGGLDLLPLSSTTERCLACHSGVTTYNGQLLPLPPPPDAIERGFSMSPVGMHPDLKTIVTSADEVNGHIYKPVFAVVTTPGSIKEDCTVCHDSHNPYISTVSGQLMDCYQCHNENTALPDVQSEFNDNPTNPSRSSSIHPIHYDPSGTSPSYVECLKCHDQSRHMQGSVRLRKDPSSFENYTSDSEVWADPVNARTINQFCLECHDPNSTVAASFWKGGSEHVPPRLPAGYASGAHFNDGSLLCTDCHEYHGSVNKGLRKNEYGDEESFCYGCHNNPANSMSGINIQAKFAQTNRHDVDASSQSANASKVECESCHNPHVVTRTSPVVSQADRNTAASSDTAFCISCHDSDAAADVRFPGYSTGTGGPEWNTSDGSWNKWNKQAYDTSPHDTHDVGCVGCHDPHGSPNYSMLLQNISTTTGINVGFGVHSTLYGERTEEIGLNSLCSSCHKDAMGVYDGFASFTSLTFGRKKGIDKNCTYCHNPHGTAQNNLMRSDKPLDMDMSSPGFGSVFNFKGFANSTTGAPYYSFCSSRGCHVSERNPSVLDTFSMDLAVDNFTHDETASSHHPIKEGVLACTSCHKEHGSTNSPDLRAPFYRESNWPELFHSGRGTYSTYHRPSYGTPFDGTNYFELSPAPAGWPPDATHRNQVTTVNPPSDANDLCYMCHMKDDIIGTTSGGMTGANTGFLGHESVEGGAVISHNIALAATGEGTDFHNFSCSFCHFPHSSSKGKLLKVGCFSQADNQTMGEGGNNYDSTIFQCHAYNKWTNSNAGWRNLTTVKADFKRPPNKVSDLTFTVDADLTVNLNWTAVEDLPGQGAHHYNVYRSNQPLTQETKPNATRIMKGLAGPAAGLPVTYADLTGQPGAVYYYAVVACDSENNESFVSNYVSVTLGTDTVAPNAISSQLTVQVDGTYNVKVSWSDPGDNVNVTSYKVYRINGLTPLTGTDITTENFKATVTDTSQSADGSPDAVAYSYTDSTTTLGGEYSYAVVALDGASNVSAVPTAATFSVTIVDPAPAAVTTLTAKPVTNAMSARLDWTAPANIGNISGYNVYRKAGSALTQSDLVPGNKITGPMTGLTYTDSTVPATATDYFYAVTAIDESSGKESGIGNSPSVNIPAPPASLVSWRQFNSSVGLSWNAPSFTTNFQNYKVYRRRDTGSWTLATTVTTTSAAISLLGLEPGTYEYGLTANYSTYGGTTPYESVMSQLSSMAVTDTAVPLDFTVSGSLTPASNFAKASVAWNAPADTNYSGYSAIGLDYYRVEATYNQGSTWYTLISTRLTNPGFETHTGTVDDASADGFTGWSVYNTTALAVSDALFDSRAIKIKYNGSGDRYLMGAESSTGQSIAGMTYSMSFWAKANKDTTFEYFIQNSGGSPDEKPGIQSNVPIGRQWQRFTAIGTFGGTQTATAARVVIRPSTDTAAQITVDGVRLESSTNALLANDGTWFRPDGYDNPGNAQTYEDPVALTTGTSAKYRVKAYDLEGNVSNAATTAYVYAKPSPITNLNVTNSATASANILLFSPSASLAGLYRYNIYAKEQASPLSGLTGATLIGTLTPTVGSGNIALSATATASHTYSSYVASNVKDGSTSTRWDGLHSVGPNWLELNFGSTVKVSSVSFDFYNSTYYRPKDFQIQTYNGSGWDTRFTVTDNTNNTPSYTLDPPVSTSKVRIYITKTNNDTLMSYRPIINEFRAYGMEEYVHDLQNTAMKAEVGHTYSYAVIAEDVNSLTSDMSGGTTTYKTIVDKDPPAKVTDLAVSSPVGTSQAILTWSTPIDNLGFGTGTGAATYQIYRLPTSSIGTPEAVTDSNYTTSSLVYTGTYTSSVPGTFNNYTASWYDHKGVYYAVRSSDAAGNWSPISNSPYIVVGKDVEAPVPPVITDCVPVTTPEVDVYWNPATDNVGINGYRLFRAHYDEEPFLTDKCITENNVDMAEVAVSLIPYNAVSAADTGGEPGRSYYFALRAWDDENNLSNISNCAVATVRTSSTDSTLPVWGATPLSVVQQPYPDIDLIWDPATDQDDSGGTGTIDHYDIYRSLTSFTATADPGVTKLDTVSGVRHSYVDRTGNHDTTYYYGLVAIDASVNANKSVLSNIGSATVAVAPSPDNTPPSVPANFAAATGVYPFINVSWSASTDLDDAGSPKQLMYYKLYRSDYPLDITGSNKNNPDLVKTFIMANDATSYVARGVGDAVYNYSIEAFDLAGNSSGLSSQVTAQVAPAPCVDTTPPSAPTALSAIIGPSPDMDLSWTASTDNGGSCNGVIDHYELYRADFEITADTDLRTLQHIHISGNSSSFIDSSGEPNRQYWYVLTAVDSSANESAKSNIITKTTAADTMAPAAVADLLATPATGYAHLTWCKPSDNVGIDHYEIYRKEQSTILTDADMVEGNRIAVFVNSGTCLSYNDSGALSGHTYSYAVISVDGAGNRSTISRGEQTGDTIAIMP